MTQPVSGYLVTAALWMRAPSAALDRDGRAVAAVLRIRSCAALVGTDTLLAVAWLRRESDLRLRKQIVHPARRA